MQRIPRFFWPVIAGCLVPALALVIISVVAPQAIFPQDERPTVFLLYASSGSIPQLLNTDQIDASMIWEPIVSNAQLSGMGKRIAVPSDLPPYGKWDNAAINVLVLDRRFIERYPEQAALLSALTTAGIWRTNADRPHAENISAAWVFGRKPILTAKATLDPLAVEKNSFDNMVFTADAQPPEAGIVEYAIGPTFRSGGKYDPEGYVSPEIAARGRMFLNGSAVPQPGGGIIPQIELGYIPSSDNYAPVYVMVEDSAYFCDRYNFCLVPDDPALSRPVHCTLLVNGSPAARVDLLPGSSGGGIMTTIGQGALDGAYVGSVPAELQIALGNPASIIQSVNTGGSGLVVAPDAPCSNWEGFVAWAYNRSAAGRPLVIATVQSSIQEGMIREACESANLTVKFYGTDIETDY